MGYNVIVSKEAQMDIEETLDYIALRLENVPAAKNLLDRIVETYDNLSQNPRMYSLCNDERLLQEGYRKAVVNNYILVNKIDEMQKNVNILRLFFGRRDYEKMI